MTNSRDTNKSIKTHRQNIIEIIKAYWPTAVFLLGLLWGTFRMQNTINVSAKSGEQNSMDISFIKEHYATKEEVKANSDKIEDYHAEMHKQTDADMKAIEEVADWMHYEKGRQAGYKQALDEFKIKK